MEFRLELKGSPGGPPSPSRKMCEGRPRGIFLTRTGIPPPPLIKAKIWSLWFWSREMNSTRYTTEKIPKSPQASRVAMRSFWLGMPRVAFGVRFNIGSKLFGVGYLFDPKLVIIYRWVVLWMFSTGHPHFWLDAGKVHRSWSRWTDVFSALGKGSAFFE